MIKAVIFDWGGVLAPSDQRYAANKLIQKYDFDKDLFLKTLAQKEEECGEDGNDQPFLDAIQTFNLPVDEVVEILNETAPNELFTFTKEIPKTFMLAILSNQVQFRTDAIKERYDLSHFTHQLFSSEMGTQKPKASCFQKMLETVNIPAENCLFVDDRLENIEAAQALKIQTIYCKDIQETIKELKHRLALD